jgi:hypothetical protein
MGRYPTYDARSHNGPLGLLESTKYSLPLNLLAALSANMATARTCDAFSRRSRVVERVTHICRDDGIVIRRPTTTKTHELRSYPDDEEKRREDQGSDSRRIGHRVTLVLGDAACSKAKPFGDCTLLNTTGLDLALWELTQSLPHSTIGLDTSHKVALILLIRAEACRVGG